MKKILGGIAAAAVAGLLLSGCELFNPKPKPDDKSSGKDGKGGGGGGGGAPEMDYSTMVTESTPYPAWPKDGAGIKSGWFYEKKTKTAAGENTTRFAVVGQAGDMWKIETNERTYAYSPGLIEAVVVQKDGTVPEAYVGKKGAKIKAIKINPMPKGGEKPEEMDEKVSVKAGEFAAKKYTSKGADGKVASMSWMGTDGDTKDVMLKMELPAYPAGNMELAKMPESMEWPCGGKKYKVWHLTYSNGTEYWNLADGPWPVVGATVKMVMTGAAAMTMEVTNMGEDAKPELSWEKEAAK
ncbi:hypothetical protein HY251_18885 [bacterium]|nr:hypothetical protein [bacterium]